MAGMAFRLPIDSTGSGKTWSWLIFQHKAVESAPLTGIGGKRRIRRGLTAACNTRVMRETPCSRKIWKETR